MNKNLKSRKMFNKNLNKPMQQIGNEHSKSSTWASVTKRNKREDIIRIKVKSQS